MSDDFAIYAAFLDGSGAIQASQVLVGEPNDMAGDEFEPAIASDGTRFLVAWDQSDTLHSVLRGRYFGADAQPLTGAFDIASSISFDMLRPSVAHLGGAGDRFLVAYCQRTFGTLTSKGTIQCRLLTSDPFFLLAPQTLTAPSLSADFPRVASNETAQEFLVAWEETDDT